MKPAKKVQRESAQSASHGRRGRTPTQSGAEVPRRQMAGEEKIKGSSKVGGLKELSGGWQRHPRLADGAWNPLGHSGEGAPDLVDERVHSIADRIQRGDGN